MAPIELEMLETRVQPNIGTGDEIQRLTDFTDRPLHQHRGLPDVFDLELEANGFHRSYPMTPSQIGCGQTPSRCPTTVERRRIVEPRNLASRMRS